MAPKDSSTRYHPYDPNKKPRIHRTTPSSNPNYNYARKQKKPPNSNDTTTITSSSQKSTTGLSVNDLKRRIRDVKRLLGHANLSPEARIVQERALAGYEKDLKEEQERRKRSEMIKKYHFVRFLDRKTATKDLRTAQRRLEKIKSQEEGEGNDTEIAKLQAEIDLAQINVNYTIYYPLTEKYISLYPQDKKREAAGRLQKRKRNSEDDEGDENDTHDEMQDDATAATKTTDQKPPMWYIVKKCMDENTLEQLRDGKLSIGSSNVVAKSDSTKGDSKEKEKKNKEEDTKGSRNLPHKKVEEDEEDEDSDGGFFE